MLNKRAIYVCCISEPWIKVIEELKALGVEPAHIIHWRDDVDDYQRFSDGHCNFQTVESAWRGMGFPYDSVALDEPSLKKIAWYESQAIVMMSRLDPTEEAFPAVSRQIFFRQLVGYWLAVISKQKVDVVISPSIPHRVFDYALYTACQLKDISFLSFQLTPFGSNSILIDDVDNMPKVSIEGKLAPSTIVRERVKKVLAKYDEAIPDYMVKHKINNSSIFKPIEKIVGKVTKNLRKGNFYKFAKPNTYWCSKGALPNEMAPGWIDYLFTKAKNRAKLRTLRKRYAQLASKSIPLDSKFVFVALHYQPEETTCPTGGAYNDQLLIIQLLNEVLPKDVNIVVKEHKSQFYSDQEGAAGRNLVYYRRLMSISERVYFSSVEDDPFSLIDKAQATVTVSGTIGWESAIRGTPSMIFGRAWYEGMPNVYRIKDKKGLVDTWSRICDASKKVEFEEILAFHGALEASFVTATHYKSYIGKGDVNMEQSVVNLVASISNYLKG